MAFCDPASPMPIHKCRTREEWDLLSSHLHFSSTDRRFGAISQWRDFLNANVSKLKWDWERGHLVVPSARDDQ
jgi:hypothetical protein